MTDLVVLTEYLVKRLVAEPEAISVKKVNEDDEKINIEVLVSPADMPRIIGKGGMIANSIRTIVQASSYINVKKKVFVNFDSI